MDFVRIGSEVRSVCGKISIGEVFYVGNSDEKIGIEMLKVQFCVIFPILPEDGKSERKWSIFFEIKGISF